MADWRDSEAVHDGVTRTPIRYTHDPACGRVLVAFISPTDGFWVLCEHFEISRHDNFDDVNDAADIFFEQAREGTAPRAKLRKAMEDGKNV